MSFKEGEIDLGPASDFAYGEKTAVGTHGYDIRKTYSGESYRYLLRSWGIPMGSRVLDIAAGKGEAAGMIAWLYKADVHQTDISLVPLLMQNRRRRNNSIVSVAEALHQPYVDHTFDAIHVKDVLVHIQNKQALFAEARRLLRPGGSLLIVSQEHHRNMAFITYAPHDRKRISELVESKYLKDYQAYTKFCEYLIDRKMMFKRRRVEQLSPMYFGFTTVELNEIAGGLGFLRIDKDAFRPKWEPDPPDQDWHHTGRYVLEYRQVK